MPASKDDVKSYMKNLGKSLSYSVKSTVTSNMPILANTVSTNSEIMKTGSSYVKNLLTQKKTGNNSVGLLVNKYMSDIETMKKNAFEDLRSGKINNFERAANESMKSMGMDFDLNWDDDMDFDSLDDNTDMDAESTGLLSTTMAIKNSAKVNEVGSNFRTKMMINAVTDSTEASAKYLGKTQTKLTTLLLNNQAQIHTEQIAMMENTNKLLTSIFQFQNETMAAHMDKELSFFDNILSEVRELKEGMLGGRNNTHNQQKRSNIEDIFGYNGSFNLQAYGKNIKRNASDMLMSSGLGMMGSMSAMGGGPLEAIKNNPLGMVSNLVVSGLMPKTMKTAMKNLDTSLSGLFGTLAMSLNSAKNDMSKSTASQLVAQLLGINFDEKTSINVGKYVRDAVPYTGKTDKAITEVIPTLLGHILTAVRGEGSDTPVFDYTSGKFTTAKEVISSTKDRVKSAQNSSMYDVRAAMDKQLRKADGGSSKNAQDDLDNFIQFLSSSNQMYNPLKDKDYAKLNKAGLNLNDPRMYNVIRAAFLNMPKNMQSSVNMKRILSKSSMSGTFSNIENDLFGSGLSAAFSGLGEVYKKPAPSSPKGGPNPSGSNGKLDDDFEKLVNQPFESMQTVMASFDDASKSFSSAGANSFFKSLMAEKNFGKRVTMLKNKVGSPGQLITGMINKLDTMVYHIIYGKEDGKTSDDGSEPPSNPNSIIGRFSIGFKKAMNKATDFIDNKILTPLHEKFFGEKGIFTKLQDKYGNPIKEKVTAKGKDLMKYLMGVKTDGFYSGGALSEFGNTFVDTGRALKSIFTGKGYKRSDGYDVKGDKDGGINSYIKNYMYSIKDFISTGLFGNYEQVQKEDGFGFTYKRKGDGLLNTIFNSMKDLGSVFGSKVSDMNPETKKTMTDWSKELKGFLPKGTSSGLMGGAAGLLMGNPILGAMLGTSLGFAAHSKKFRTYLFGDEENDGVIPKKYTEMIKKYTPSTIAGAILGGLGSIVLPGGALLGVLMGSSLGFVKQSSAAQKFLFGDAELGKDGVVPKKYIDAYKKHSPGMMAGGVLGLIGSIAIPGGSPLLGIALGATLGYAKKSESFQTYLFGKDADEDGKGATNGLLGKEIKKHLGKIIGGGTLGMITGFMGLPGGPLVGAMIGASLGYASRTEKFKKFIFGDKEDENSNSVKDVLKKYAPNIGGTVLGMLGVIPGGSLGGLLIGSALGMVAKTDKFKELIYGTSKDGDGNEERNITKFVKKHFPTIAGGVLGAIGGLGFGVLPGLLMGAAVNWMSKSETAKSMLFGKEDKDGNLQGGLLPFLKRNYKIPAGMLLGLTGVIPGGVVGGLLIGTAVNFATKTDDLKHLIFGEKDADGNQIKKNIFQRVKGLLPSIAGVALSTIGAIPGGPIVGLLVGSAFGIMQQTNNLQNFLFGKELDENGKPTSNIVLALKKYTPIIAGGLVGSIASLGLGPIAGMLIGTAVGWVSKTDAVKNILFGEKDADGNVIKKSIFKQLPKMAPGIIGTILGATGLIPGGPLVGLLVGSAFSLIASTGNLKTALFGEKDVDGKTVKKSLLQRIPGIAPGVIGGLLGQFAGLGFGPVTGILVGSAISFVAQSQTFKELIFGKKDADGKELKPNLFKRMKKFIPAGIGGLLAMAGILPGGPIIGMLIGTTVQWVGKSQIFQDIIFGKDKDASSDPKKGIMSRIKGLFPKGAKLLKSTSGLVTDLIVGSAIGFSTKLNAFTDMLLGKKDGDKRTGGLFKSIGKGFSGARSGIASLFKFPGRSFSKNKTVVAEADDDTDIDVPVKKGKVSVGKSIGKGISTAFRGIGSFFKKFVSNTKKAAALPKIMFMNKMLQNVKDKESYDTTMLGMVHQIAVNTADGSPSGDTAATKSGGGLGDLLGGAGGLSSILSILGTLLAGGGTIKELLEGDGLGAAGNVFKWGAKRFTQPVVNLLKKFGASKFSKFVFKGAKNVVTGGGKLIKKGLGFVSGKAKDLFTFGKNALFGSADDIAGDVLENTAEKAAKNVAVDATVDVLSKSAAKGASKGIIPSILKTMKTFGSNTIFRGAKGAAEKVITDDGTAVKFTTKITKLLTSPKLVKAFGKFGAAMAKHTPKIVKVIGEKVAKAGASIMAKVALKLNLVVSIGFLVYDFTTGMAECKNIFQLPATSEPTLGMRIASGLGKMLSGVVYSLISSKYIAEIIYDIIGSDDERMVLKEQQDQAKEDLVRYNSYTGETLTMDDYQSRLNTTVGGKVWNFATGKKKTLVEVPSSYISPSSSGNGGGTRGDPTNGMRGVNRLHPSTLRKLAKLGSRNKNIGDPAEGMSLQTAILSPLSNSALATSMNNTLSGKYDTTSDSYYAKKYAYALDTRIHPKSDVTIADLRMVEELSKQYGVPADLWWSLVDHESDFYSKAIGGSDDTGWGQVIPGTGRGLYKKLFNSDNYIQPDTAFDKETNARMSMYYLRSQYDKTNDWLKALSLYNTGSKTDNTVYSGGVAADYRRNTGRILTANLMANSPSGANTYASTNDGTVSETTTETGITSLLNSITSAFGSTIGSVFDISSLSDNITKMFTGLDPFTGTMGTNTSKLGTVDDNTNSQYIRDAGAAYKKLYGDLDSHDFVLQRLAALAQSNGKDINVTSGFRTIARQQYLYDNWFNEHPEYNPNTEEGQKARARMIAKPGRSLHNLGLAADIGSDWVKNLDNRTLEKFGLYKPMSYENWHVEPIETQLYGRNVDALATKFGTPFNPSADKDAYTSAVYDNIGDPIGGIPDASGYSEKMSAAVSSLNSSSSFNSEVLKILNVISASLTNLVSISAENAEILSNYIKALGSGNGGGNNTTSVAIIPTPVSTNNNPYVNNKSSVANTKQSKSSAITAIAVGNAY